MDRTINLTVKTLPIAPLSRWLLVAGALLALLLMPTPGRADQISISGLTEPAEDSTLGLSTIGRVIRIRVTEGEVVTQGQLLLEFDQELEQLEVERRKLIWQNRAELDSVIQQVKTLGQHLQATRDLYQSTGSVPQEELENKELEYTFAVAEQSRLEIAKRREKIEYSAARQQLAKRNLYAPFSGEVVEVLVGVGENCDVDTPLLRLVDTSLGYFVANLELPLSQQLTLGQQVELRFDSGLEPIRKDAKISFISPLIDPASGLRKIKAEFANQEDPVVPGVAGNLLLRR